MTDETRYADLKKLRTAPAARLLAAAGMKLDAEVEAPANAPPAIVLAELEDKAATLDALKLFSLALPAREGVWWACLAWRDIFAGDDAPPCLAAAEAWVFKPGDATREDARKAMEAADRDDDTVFCAMGALYSDGKLGPGDLAEYDAAIGATGMSVHAAIISALFDPRRTGEAPASLLIDRALDIAKGGSGIIGVKEGESAIRPEAGGTRKDVA